MAEERGPGKSGVDGIAASIDYQIKLRRYHRCIGTRSARVLCEWLATFASSGSEAVGGEPQVYRVKDLVLQQSGS